MIGAKPILALAAAPALTGAAAARNPAMEWSGGGLVSASRDVATWGHAPFAGAGVAIHADTRRALAHGHGGWVPGHVPSLRPHADHRVTAAFQINTDVGTLGHSTDLVPALEAALADLAVDHVQELGQ